ncbi:hypothetical protein CC78DRAFT_57097 [Lojkania enalia]|uniref:Uncharacterized protein n=1 Tax=Lojkania enalia TaxID=147567 RepID=A0A9P4K513_9PLEO|nr:hypothetical protein CC78DRAFT_57097 [Didymosphaeria enalia]
MPIRKAEKKAIGLTPDATQRTGEYSNVFSRPEPYKPIRAQLPTPSLFPPGSIPAFSTRELSYFFKIAGTLYSAEPSPNPSHPASHGFSASPAQDAPLSYSDAPPTYGDDFQRTNLDASAILVMCLFRLTRIDIFPIAERFHLGPADRQPLYSLTAQPSIRSATEFNELAIMRRDPITGIWHSTCTSNVEPSLDLVKPGNWAVAWLVMESMPVWKKIVSGQVLKETAYLGKGNSLRLSWGDRHALGPLGNAYGLWWDSGNEGGLAEAFYVVEGWGGFDTRLQGVIRVKSPIRNANGRYLDPRSAPGDLATIYFHSDGKTPPQFVCANVEAQVRLDIIMAGLMTVMVVENRKVSVMNERGILPAYDSGAQWSSPLVEEGVDLGWGTERL